MIAIDQSEVNTTDKSEFAKYASRYLEITVDNNPFIPVKPHYRQMLFLVSMHEEVLFGGAAGGGKSIAILMAALQRVILPGYHALLLRRTFADLAQPDALMSIADNWLTPTTAQWEGSSKTWHFPPYDSTLTFGYLDTEKDKYRYQGPQFQFIGFDELTQFTETQYLYLSSRLRRSKANKALPIMRATSNPGGVGHEWVKNRFIGPNKHPSAIMIRSLIDDNPSLEAEEYKAKLSRLDAVTRAQLLHGDWDIMPSGNMFKRHWFNIIELPPREYIRAVRFWDLAATPVSIENPDPDWVVGVRMVKTHAGRVVVTDVRRFRGTPAEVEANVRQTALIDGKDTGIFIEEEPGSNGHLLIDNYRRHVLVGYTVMGVKSTGDKIYRARPYSAAAEGGQIDLVRGHYINSYLDELCIFPAEKEVHDDQVDASSGAFIQLMDLSHIKSARPTGPKRRF